MGLLNAGLAMLTVGYIVGVWTACVISRVRPRRDGRDAPWVLWARSARLSPETIWISVRRR